ncbi:MAG: homoserine O-acetyltransferase [Bacteroidetes bacterium HGW-Bacteroidetes-4]|nr:MAG: homoserine O-acetyltransferase [Bacteroidetes bacterium HGW-Bacteroidetes-4]
METTDAGCLIKPEYLSHDGGKNVKYLKHAQEFKLESGAVLPELEIAYTTYGKLNREQNNVVWMCHAFTANSDPVDWWPGMVGEGHFFDPKHYFIVCANILGSCYGSTGPLSTNPLTGTPYYLDFPLVTVRDQVQAHELLRTHLGIDKIHLVLGCSIGGHQALEWTISNPALFDHAIYVATNAVNTPWVTAFNESQRLAIEADPTFFEKRPNGGARGMKAARSMALISYRNPNAYNKTQAEDDLEKTDGYRASSYQAYQGNKLVKRFNAYSYYYLSKALDSHNVGRSRGGYQAALSKITAKTLVISIDTDLLFSPDDQQLIHQNIPGSRLEILESFYGHDGFLLEFEKQNRIYADFLNVANVHKTQKTK